ncbi:hypothetical protein AOC36_02850 [Erysipelothrix larvae]|uniref:Bifunctional metallophosphatase/5'-nucleotidase n=1 Tax=Erysipelothrix larvae TaxID=1514105 RepID=A0A0X8GYY8_9FIRM|nr:5'-nucleotidase C-terminal domain-containing protein [Erysipelothrix larvae]AMC92959.1 hypothetical protein AOC36_02850 [Erysipelothrix larvae]
MLKKFKRFGLIISILLMMSGCTSKQTVENSPIDLLADAIVLHTNDTHGYVKADDENGVIGFDTIAAIKERVGDKGLLLDAGDMSNGIPFASKSKGQSPIEVMNAVGYDGATLGNHEFDVDGNVDAILEAADFPFMSANTRYKEDGSLLTHAHQIYTINGVNVGVFGLTTTESALNPVSTRDLDFGNQESIIEDAQAQADALSAQGCDIIIVLSHLGVNEVEGGATSLDIAKALGDKVDVIIDAHTHTSPLENKEVNGVPIVSAGGETDSNVGWITFTENSNDDYDVEVGFIDYNTAREMYTPVSSITSLIDELNGPVEAMATKVVTHVDTHLDGEREMIRTQETNLGNTLADAVLAFTDADIAMLNSGGIRASIDVGDVTELEIYTTFPYGDSVYVSKVLGSVILDALEIAVSNYPEAEGTFAQVAGLVFSFNPSQDIGNRVTSVTVNGEVLDTTKEYVLATNDYWATGGDGYDLFIEPFKTPYDYDKPQESVYITDVFLWYLNQKEGVTSNVEGRIIIE